MKRYRILGLVLVFVVLAVLIVLRLTQVSAQTVNVKVTPMTVSRAVLFKVNPGQRGAFDQDVMSNLIPVYEEEKKAGVLTSYQFFNNVTADNPNDWNVAIVFAYPNYATLDTLGDRVDPIELKHYGSAAKRQAAAEHRNQIRTVVSNRLMRAISYGQGTHAS
jgi:hypothetical protein